MGVCELLARPLPAIPTGATRGRGASAQKSALKRSSPGGRFPTVLEYSEPRGLPSAQESKSLCGWAGVRAPRRGAGGDSGARPPVLARERARPRELARCRVHFYPSAAKNSPRAPSGARNSGPQIRQDDSALPGSGRGRQRGGEGSGDGLSWASPRSCGRTTGPRRPRAAPNCDPNPHLPNCHQPRISAPSPSIPRSSLSPGPTPQFPLCSSPLTVIQLPPPYPSLYS